MCLLRYIVQDPLGVNSSAATVALEVFPQHNAPVARDKNVSNIFAGKPMNTIELSPVVTVHLQSFFLQTNSIFLRSCSFLTSCVVAGILEDLSK